MEHFSIHKNPKLKSDSRAGQIPIEAWVWILLISSRKDYNKYWRSQALHTQTKQKTKEKVNFDFNFVVNAELVEAQILWKRGQCPGPEVIKLFSCSTQLSMKFFMLVNLKLLTMPIFFLLNIAEHENFSANKYENANNSWHFHIY